MTTDLKLENSSSSSPASHWSDSLNVDPGNYRMPAEWERHSATWITWPKQSSDSFNGDYYSPMLPGYCELIRQIAEGEEVHINFWDVDHEKEILSILNRQSVPIQNIFLHHHPSYEPWCRDHGPVFTKLKSELGAKAKAAAAADSRKEPLPDKIILNWEYNAWGGKYPPYDLDNQIPQRIAQFRNLPCITPGMILEGGSIEVNGLGTVITTESCLLNPNRNPHLSKSEIESQLRRYLGVNEIIWLLDGVKGDDTDGHIDDLTRFVSANSVVTILPDSDQHPDYPTLNENYSRLKNYKNSEGKGLDISLLPCPDIMTLDGVTLPASYANFYICNRGVLVPTFQQPANDQRALSVLKEVFPQQEVIGIDSSKIIWGLGSFHCLTQQEPW